MLLVVNRHNWVTHFSPLGAQLGDSEACPLDSGQCGKDCGTIGVWVLLKWLRLGINEIYLTKRNELHRQLPLGSPC